MPGAVRDVTASPFRSTRSNRTAESIASTGEATAGRLAVAGDECPPPPDGRFPPSERLRRRSEYREVQSDGVRVHTRHFLFVLLPRDGDRTRIGITVTRKVGTAVRRNRVKRVVREVFRTRRDLFPDGCDVVCIAKRGAPELGYTEALDEVHRVRHVLRRAARRARDRGGDAT